MGTPPKPDEHSINRARVARRASRWLREMLDVEVQPGELLDADDVPSLGYIADEPTEEVHRANVEALLAERDADPEDRLQ